MTAPAVRRADDAIAIETPELVEVTYTLAGVGSRAVAALVDLLLAGLILVAVDLVAAGAWRALRAFGAGAGPWLLGVMLLVQFALVWGYSVLFEWLGDGRTPGKRLLGLRVVMDGGYSVTLAASALRNLVRFVDAQPLFTYGVGLAAAVASKRGKRLGDLVAGTLVVRERVARDGAPRERAASGRSTAGRLTDRGSRDGRGAPAPAPAPAPARATLLDDDRYALLERFAARRGALDPERAAALSAQLAGHLRPASTPSRARPTPRRRARAPVPATPPCSAACWPASARRGRAARWSPARAARGGRATRSWPRAPSGGRRSPRGWRSPGGAGWPRSPRRSSAASPPTTVTPPPTSRASPPPSTAATTTTPSGSAAWWRKGTTCSTGAAAGGRARRRTT
jgi:uncharacterized RDD family membrane protein YckC